MKKLPKNFGKIKISKAVKDFGIKFEKMKKLSLTEKNWIGGWDEERDNKSMYKIWMPQSASC